MDALKIQSIELLLNQAEIATEQRGRLDMAKTRLMKIDKDYRARAGEIHENKQHFDAEGQRLQRDILDKAIRARVNEVRDGLGFNTEIADTKKAMTIPEPDTEIGQLIQLLREQEIRSIMRAEMADETFPKSFIADIMEGTPIVISAIENSPVPIPLDEGVLQNGKDRRLEVVNPTLAAKLRDLQVAQSTLDVMVQNSMPVGINQEDSIADLANS